MSLQILILTSICITLVWHLIDSRVGLNKEDLSELGIALLINIIFASLMAGTFTIYKNSKVKDTQIFNGEVLKKEIKRVSCSHSYQCMCVTQPNGPRICQTCYRHAYDLDYIVYTSVGDIKIKRIDSRGINVPPRFEQVKIGEPASLEYNYKNYLLSSKDTLFLDDYQSIKEKYSHYTNIPYPRTRDYYRINRVVDLMNSRESRKVSKEINDYLNDELKTLGKSHQLNIVVYITREDEDFFYHIINSINGGKQNDVILVLGLDKNVKYIKSTSFAKGTNNALLHNKIALFSSDLKTTPIKAEDSLTVIRDVLVLIKDNFKRVPPEQYQFKMDAIEIPVPLIIFIILLNIGCSVGINLFLSKQR